jgi:hypothetical protein
MSSESTVRKVRVRGYLDRYAPALAGPAPAGA